MRRLFLALALVLAVAPVAARQAHAYETWCFDDPVVDINGQRVSIDIGVQGTTGTVHQNVRRVDVVISVPAGVSTALVSSTHRYFRENVTFVTSNVAWQPGQPVPVTVTVQFEAKATLPAAMNISKGGTLLASAQGSTGTGLSAQFSLQ